ncbi:MAG TPA: L,D-transpeptidase family protein [Candidatus Aquilonibacter sp.]|nr:L,D-transpeptidase family protein [Candidatus Aquilonibacter sp.]
MTWRQRGVLGLLALVLAFLPSCAEHDPLPEGTRADKIVIVKSAHTMSLISGSRVLRTYKVALGRDPVGPKTRAGDHKTPEGDYVIDAKKSQSKFHLALHISYPNEADRERGLRDNVDPGSDVEIHGLENGLGWIGGLQRHFDWTDGCIAVTDHEMDEIWKAVSVGTPVEIRP